MSLMIYFYMIWNIDACDSSGFEILCDVRTFQSMQNNSFCCANRWGSFLPSCLLNKLSYLLLYDLIIYNYFSSIITLLLLFSHFLHSSHDYQYYFFIMLFFLTITRVVVVCKKRAPSCSTSQHITTRILCYYFVPNNHTASKYSLLVVFSDNEHLSSLSIAGVTTKNIKIKEIFQQQERRD